MARVKSIVQLRGRIRDDHFTKRIGEKGVIMSANGGATASQIRTLPQFALTRENNSEFVALQLFGKTMKNLLVAFLALCTNNYNFMREVTRQVKKIQLADTVSLRGQREILHANIGNFLLNLQFNRKSNLFSSFVGQYNIAINGSRNGVVFTPISAGNECIIAPKGATHFRLSLALISIADVVYNSGTGYYELASGAHAPTDYALNQDSWRDITEITVPTALTAGFDGTPVMTTVETVFACVCIEFAQEVNSVFNKMASKDAGAIVAIS